MFNRLCPVCKSTIKLNKTQKNNIRVGKQKDMFVLKNNKNIIRFWEWDINNLDISKLIMQKLDKTFINE